MLKKIQWTAVVLIIVSNLYLPCIGLSQSINWKSYQEGIQLSKKENKKVFLHFRTDWCGFCKKMDLLTFSDSRIIEFLNDHFIAVKVDGDRETKIRDAHSVRGFPDNRFLDSNRKQVHRLSGFIQPEKLLFFLEYIHTDSYKKMDPKQYYETR